MTSIHVAVAERSPLLLESLARTIRQDSGLQLAAQARRGDELLAAVRSARPGIAVAGERLRDPDVSAVLAAIARDELPTRMVVLAAGTGAASAYGTIAAGARGYLAGDATPEALREAIRRVASGETVLCRRAQTAVAREIRLRDRAGDPLLTRRELEILELTATGLSCPQIARRLHLAPATVKTHALHAYAKLGVGERAQAVAEAMRRGLLA